MGLCGQGPVVHGQVHGQAGCRSLPFVSASAFPVDRCGAPPARRMRGMAFDRITFDADVMGGRACLRGMRIPVSLIVRQLAHGATVEEVLADYPDLEREDVEQALQYAAWVASEQILAG
jgi:uncharacterized protein (DUF433 family)